MMGLEFQVSDVTRPLAALWRIAEKGNIIQFGPGREDNFIQNVSSGQRVKLERNGGSYVMPVELMWREREESDFTRQVRRVSRRP